MFRVKGFPTASSKAYKTKNGKIKISDIYRLALSLERKGKR